MAQAKKPNEAAWNEMYAMKEEHFKRIVMLFQAQIITQLEARQQLGLPGGNTGRGRP